MHPQQETEMISKQVFLQLYLRYRGHGEEKVEPGHLLGKRAGLVIEMLRVRIPAGAAGEFSSPEPTLCADSFSVSLQLPCYRSGT